MKLIRVRFVKDHINGIPAGAEQSYHEAHAKRLIDGGFAVEISDDGPGNGKDCSTCGGEIAEEVEGTTEKKVAPKKTKQTINKDSIS